MRRCDVVHRVQRKLRAAPRALRIEVWHDRRVQTRRTALQRKLDISLLQVGVRVGDERIVKRALHEGYSLPLERTWCGAPLRLMQVPAQLAERLGRIDVMPELVDRRCLGDRSDFRVKDASRDLAGPLALENAVERLHVLGPSPEHKPMVLINRIRDVRLSLPHNSREDIVVEVVEHRLITLAFGERAEYVALQILEIAPPGVWGMAWDVGDRRPSPLVRVRP